jgi:predicted nucleic acid-binding Zn ribbon protein
MPTYVYRFLDTDETIEVQQSFSDATLTEHTHPTTGATMPVKKVFLPVGVTFKGDGFYKTDSRPSKKPKSSTAAESSSSTGSSSSETSQSSSTASSTSPTTSSSTSKDAAPSSAGSNA